MVWVGCDEEKLEKSGEGQGKGGKADTTLSPRNLSGQENAPHFRDDETEVREVKGLTGE